MTQAGQLDLLIRHVQNLPYDVAAREVHGHFYDLPPATARALAKERYEQVGPLDGAPPELRYVANRRILVDARRTLQAKVAAGRATRAQDTRFRTLDAMLEPVSTTEDVDGRLVKVVHDRRFLYVDPVGQGRMVELLGEDLGKAKNVATLVPGLNNTLEKTAAQVDRGYDLLNEAGPGTAVVVWKGYDAPLTLEEAMSTECARAAVPLVSRFDAGLAVVMAPEAERTLIGNSYGSQVVGLALLAGMDPESPDGVHPDRPVLIGCPGVEPSVHSAAQLVPPGKVLYVARTPWDYVSYGEQFGPDPATFPDAFRFETRGAVPVRGHMKYFRKNSESLRNLGRIISGNLDAVTRAAQTTPEQESKLLPGVSWAESMRRLPRSEAAAPLAKVFDGVAAARKLSVPAKHKPTDGARNRRSPQRPEGPAR
ncbi:alpha/beta hydrolase family protein [Kribbella antiqua]|uniref:Alpha/beta hydrolase family protein n=1 Tax=Kribbella antiqua TaxID=2512217 RepID=A0A4V2S404_9ACTN|nr:alpha/beta hydrolase [Kribbella antiqua]TCO46390.1 alpha/beta hydrolase family protein [Kribbella antiqua]